MQLQSSVDGHSLGFIPPPVSLSGLPAPDESPESQIMSVPASYDLRTLGKVTPVKDQGNCGSCWSFATYGSLESNLLPGETWNFSENNLKNTHGFYPSHSEGGNQRMSCAYLARWSGPVSETDDPYNPSSGTSPASLTVQKHVQEVYFLPDLDKTGIKQALMNYGAVYTSMIFFNNYYNSVTHAYYDYVSDDWQYSYGGRHAVTIVGWNDNYPRANFQNSSNKLPSGNGAWIIKNSWGTGWGESGYFYLSYYDNNTARNNTVFLKPEATSNYQRIYQYDPLGFVNAIGERDHNSCWMASIYTAAASEPLVAVSFYALAPNTAYTIKIYKNTSSNNPVTGSLAYTKSGTTPFAGYHTISFPVSSPVMLTLGQKFSVVMQLTTPGFNYPIAIEQYYSGYAYPTASYNSYISTNGVNWDDPNDVGFEDSDVCMKAFVRSVPVITVQPVSQTVDTGTNVTFTAAAVGSPVLAFQWYFEEYPIEGATSRTLTLNNVSPDDNGKYNLKVSNSSGTATSKKATLTVRPLLPPPLFDLQPGTYTTPQNVSVFYSKDYPGVTIRYTTNGTEPEITSPVFSQVSPLPITKTTTLKAAAWKDGYTASSTVTAKYTITGIVTTPTFSILAGVYTSPPNVTISCASPSGVTIRYTTDGSEPTASSTQYTIPIAISSDTTLKAKAWKANWENSATATAAYTIITKVTTPTFSIPGGVYPSAQSVIIKCSTPGATIRYTTDGSAPAKTHGTVATAMAIPITVNGTLLQAIAYKTGLTDSDIVAATYKIGKVAIPVFSPPPGTYTVPGSIGISCRTTGAEIRYTTNGDIPTENSNLYAGPIALTQPVVIKARAFKTDLAPSSVISGIFNAYLPSQPNFDHVTGIFTSEQPIVITCGDGDATIRYTTNGTEPAVTSPTIASGGSVWISRTSTLKAKAFKEGWAPSLTTSATYTINTTGKVTTPVFSPPPGTYTIGSSIAISCSPLDAEIRYTTNGTTPTITSTLYEGPITFSNPMTIKAKAFKAGMASSSVASGTYTAVLPIPGFSPGTGTYGEQLVTVSCADGCDVRYTTDGTEPIATSPIAPGGMVLVNRSMTLKAKAFKAGWVSSPTQTAAYTITQAATPVFSLAEGTYTSAQSLTMSCATTGAVIHYTNNGADPTASSPAYTPGAVIPISATKTIKAIAVKTEKTNSPIKSADYTITGTVATPVFYLMGKNVIESTGTYASGLRVTVICATQGAEIHATTNGKTPTTSDPEVASGSALLIETTSTLKARAFKDTWLPSATTTETYTILQVATPEISIEGGNATISCLTPEAVIRYTTNGNDPSFSDPIFSLGVTIPMSSETTLKAKAWKTAMVPSKVALATEQYTLTVTNNGNGSTTPSGSATVNHGASTALTATPDTYYHFVKWAQTSGSGTAVFGNANLANTTVKVTGGNAAISANFVHDPCTLTVTNDGHGSTNPSGAVTVNSGASRAITATPNTGFHFVNWVKTDGLGTAVFDNANSANTTVTVSNGDATIRANFIAYHNLTVTNDGNGSTTPSGAIAVNNAASTPITATPTAGSQFLNWTKTAGTGTVVFADANSANTTVTLTDSDATISANFTIPLSTWIIGNIAAGGSKWYCFKATIGTQYTIKWDDSYSGSDTYTCDVKVGAFYKDLSTDYFTGIDSGYYSPQIITAVEDYFYIFVQGYSSSSYGSFALKVN
jgi:C1A family cysteine protease